MLACKHKQDVELIVSCDNDDPCGDLYSRVYTNWDYPVTIVFNNNKSAVDAINNAAKVALGDILIVVSDDTRCPHHWDEIINTAMGTQSGLLKVYDGVQKWICTMPVMSYGYYKHLGHVYHPDYLHMFCDTDLTHQADLERKLIFRNDIVFKHDHYSAKGSGNKKDYVNEKADKTWAQGEKVYLQRCRDKFGLGNVDIFNLSKEAKEAGHVQWLKKKLR
jgi:glycosyltransferase involved in cell wall biosynthesis